MDRHDLSPLELLAIASQHAYAADNLLQQIPDYHLKPGSELAIMTPITSLLYHAFRLTLNAYCVHEHRPLKEYKKLMELVELNRYLGFSSKEISLFKTLSQQQAFVKGKEYTLWENQQQAHVFCKELIALYHKLQSLMPLELHPDYQ